ELGEQRALLALQLLAERLIDRAAGRTHHQLAAIGMDVDLLGLQQLQQGLRVHSRSSSTSLAHAGSSASLRSRSRSIRFGGTITSSLASRICAASSESVVAVKIATTSV